LKGRKPVPTNLKILRGNPGKRPLKKDEPKPGAPIVLQPPEHLSPGAVAEWERMAPALLQLGLLTELDIPAFEGYCEAYAEWKEAKNFARRVPGVVKTTSKGKNKNGEDKGGGNIIPHPAKGLMNTAFKIWREFLSEFGMTPSSRSRVSATPKEKPKSSAWEGFGG
jgi:P27 family predicted phage terminase small subunit